MSLPLMLVVALLFGNAAQKIDSNKAGKVELFCGKLILVEPVLMNGVPVGSQTQETPIKKTKLQLYRRAQNGRCCSKQALMAETTTAADGSFEFKDLQPGSYWIVGRRDLAHYTLAIEYAPDAKTEYKCSDLLYELKDGELKLAKMRMYVVY